MRILALTLVLLLAPSLAAQSVLLVGPGGFAQIQTAINAAANGDVIVVQSGTYQPFTLAKNLTITAAPGATVDVVSTISALTLLQPPHQARLVGLRFRSLFPVVPHLVRVMGGIVAISDCSIDTGSQTPTYPALLVQNAHVAMQRCAIFGGLMPSGTGAMTGGDAVRVVNASLAAVDCMFFGGDLSWDFSGPGGHAVFVDAADVHLVRCILLAGGNSAFLSGNAAGDGVHVASPSRVWIADSLVRGGDGHATAASSSSGVCFCAASTKCVAKRKRGTAVAAGCPVICSRSRRHGFNSSAIGSRRAARQVLDDRRRSRWRDCLLRRAEPRPAGVRGGSNGAVAACSLRASSFGSPCYGCGRRNAGAECALSRDLHLPAGSLFLAAAAAGRATRCWCKKARASTQAAAAFFWS